MGTSLMVRVSLLQWLLYAMGLGCISDMYGGVGLAADRPC